MSQEKPEPLAEAEEYTQWTDLDRLSTDALSSVVKHSPIGLAICDGHGILLSINPILCELFGCDEQGLSGCRTPDLTSNDSLAEALARVKSASGTGDEYKADVTFICTKGRHVPTETIVRRLDDPDRFLLIVRDLTECTEVEHQSAVLKDRMELLVDRLQDDEAKFHGEMATWLHDSLGHDLVLAREALNATRQGAETGADATSARIDSALQAIDSALLKTRSTTFELNPPTLETLGLIPTLEWLVRNYRQRHGIEVELSTGPIPYAVPREAENLVFRSVRELMFNAVRHAKTENIRVTVSAPPAGLEVVVKDEGCGMNSTDVVGIRKDNGGFGLFSIREQLERTGGSLEISSELGRGTSVTVRVPVRTFKIHRGRETGPVQSQSGAEQSFPQIRVMLADDHQLFRTGLVSMLQSDPKIDVVAEAANGAEAVELARRHKPDVSLMDIDMPDLDGISAALELKEVSPETKIIALSVHSDRYTVGRMLKAGVTGYLVKNCTRDDLLRAIHAARGDLAFFSPQIHQMIMEEYISKSPAGGAGTEELSEREMETLKLLAEGLTNQAIGNRLKISPKTVESHRANISRKLGLYSLQELTKFAIREGLIELHS